MANSFNINSKPWDHDPSFRIVTLEVNPGPINVSVFAHPSKTWQEIEFDITAAAERVLRSYVSAGIAAKILDDSTNPSLPTESTTLNAIS